MISQGPLPPPQLEWRDGVPSAAGFDDIYFNPEDGLAETRHVFLDGCDLPHAWLGSKNFVICELGFGTGLNFLAAWDLWQRAAPNNGHLHFISIEGAPLTCEQLARAHEAFPELGELSLQLREACPPRARGHHILRLRPDVTLHLLFADALEILAGLEANVDAWFLDGFAPAKNPAMWSPDIMAEIARCSVENSRLASFTVAGEVRRALQTVGFEVEKAPGFGNKRHMLKAAFKGPTPLDKAPWLVRPKPSVATGRIAIIGAGIAGASTAKALARAGLGPILFDAARGPGAGGSGAPTGLVMPRLSAEVDAPALFYANALRHAVTAYRQADVLSTGGALHLPPRPDQLSRLEKMPDTGLFDPDLIEFLTAEQASERSATTIPTPALYFADAGMLDTQAYLAHAVHGIETRFDCAITSLARKDEEWHLKDAAGSTIYAADIVILTAGMASAALYPQARLPLEGRNGQITKVSGVKTPLPIAYGGYLAPTSNGTWIGATHAPGVPGTALKTDPQADEKNLANLQRTLPDLGKMTTAIKSWAGTRATTPDYLPIAGPLCDAETYLHEFAAYAKGMRFGFADAPYAPGLFVVAGLASRGFVTGPLLGELIAAQILGTPLPVGRDVADILHPARFFLRKLRREG